MTRWVVDTSPLIFLAKLDRLKLLRRGALEVYVPPKVLEEVGAWSDSPAAVIDHASTGWFRVHAPRRDVAPPGTGEAAAIALALDLGADRVVLDDLSAAHREGLQVVGTLGLLLAARLRGEIRDLRREIELLKRHGFRASDALVEAILREAGEIEPPEVAGT